MGEVIKYEFWQDDDLLSLQQRLSRLNDQEACRYVYLEIHVRYKIKANNSYNDEGYLMIDFAKRGLNFVPDFFVHRIFRYSADTLSLSVLGMPKDFVEETLPPATEKFVRTMKSEPRNAGHECMAFVLAIDVLVRSIDQNEATRDKRRDMTRLPYWRRDKVHPMRPDFEIYRIKEEVDNNQEEEEEEESDVCAICLAKPALDDLFVKLVCSHSYHCACIVEFVYRGHNFCPLCRSVIPSSCKKKYCPLTLV